MYFESEVPEHQRPLTKVMVDFSLSGERKDIKKISGFQNNGRVDKKTAQFINFVQAYQDGCNKREERKRSNSADS